MREREDWGCWLPAKWRWTAAEQRWWVSSPFRGEGTVGQNRAIEEGQETRGSCEREELRRRVSSGGGGGGCGGV